MSDKYKCPKCGSYRTYKKNLLGKNLSKRRIYCKNCHKTSRVPIEQGIESGIAAMLGEYNYETVWDYVDKKSKKEVDFRRFFELAKENQQMHSDLSQSQDTGRIQFKTSREWIPIILSSDWHMGGNSVDYDQLQKHLEMVLQNEIYMLLFGDIIDNFVRFRSIQPVLEQVLNPKMQQEMLAAIIKEFQEVQPKRILAAWWGNHDVERDERLLGSSRVKALLSENFIYFNGKGVLELRINDVKYHIAGSHFFKGFSIYNKTHALIRAVRFEFGGLADLVVMGHFHNYAYSYLRDYELMQEFGYDLGGDIHLVQVGTFNVDEGYSKRFFKKGQIGLPVFLFNSQKKDIRWLKNPEYLKDFFK